MNGSTNQTLASRTPFPTFRAYCVYANHDQRLGTMVLLGVLGGMFCIMPVLMFSQFIPFWTDGVLVRGSVVGRDPVAAGMQPRVMFSAMLAHGGGGRGPTRFIQYEYRDRAGVARQAQAGVDFNTWNRLKVGDAVDVVYLAADPAQSKLWVGLDNGQWTLAAFAAIGLLVVSFGIRLFIAAVLSIRREVRLLRDGVVTEGQVVEHTSERHDKRSVKSIISYAFSAPTSFAGPPQTQQGTYTTIGSPWFKGQPGSSVAVVYSPDDPERSTIDRFGLRN